MDIFWNIITSQAGIAILTVLAMGLAAWVKAKYFPASTAWTAVEGYIISGIKIAEKVIPDTTENKSLAKADKALGYVISAYEAAKGKKPSAALVEQIKNAIPIVHNELEAAGTLSK